MNWRLSWKDGLKIHWVALFFDSVNRLANSFTLSITVKENYSLFIHSRLLFRTMTDSPDFTPLSLLSCLSPFLFILARIFNPLLFELLNLLPLLYTLWRKGQWLPLSLIHLFYWAHCFSGPNFQGAWREPIENLGPVDTRTRSPIHGSAPACFYPVRYKMIYLFWKEEWK